MPSASDVAIVGAGPAGAWAAYRLACSGARVTIFDPSHPREKPCGGGVTGRALALVADAIDLSQLSASAIRRARFLEATSGRSASVWLESTGTGIATSQSGLPSPALLVASRTEFDGALLAAARDAGADIVPARVTDVVRDSGGFRIETPARPRRAERVVGADGANSLVRRRLARPFRRDELSIATGFYAHGVTSDEIVVELVGDPPGYIWSFPRPTHLAIGICAQADAGIDAGTLRDRTAHWIRDTHIAGDARLRAYSWPIPSLDATSLQHLDLAGAGWCLVGDAAGLVDPITREGIYFALLSGMWAADCILAHESLDRYAAQVRDEIVSELIRAARFKAAFFRPAFTDLMVRALQESGEIRAVMADLVAGRQPYATLKWRLLKTFEIGLALRALVGSG
jgi:geranylgeranyl reductase family protein